MNLASSKTLLVLILASPAVQLSCVRSTTQSVGQTPVSSAHHVLSAHDAAELAARLANDQCNRQFGRRPFTTVNIGGEILRDVETGLHRSPIFDREAGLLGNGLFAHFETITIDAVRGGLVLGTRR